MRPAPWRFKREAIDRGRYTSAVKSVFTGSEYFDRLEPSEVSIFRASKICKMFVKTTDLRKMTMEKRDILSILFKRRKVDALRLSEAISLLEGDVND
jgi:hypothetical protein